MRAIGLFIVWVALFLSIKSSLATDFSNVPCDAAQIKLSALHILDRQIKARGVPIEIVDIYDIERLPASASAELHCQAGITLSTGEEGYIYYRAFLGKSGRPLIEVKVLSDRIVPEEDSASDRGT